MVALAATLFAVSGLAVVLVLIAIVERVADDRFDRVGTATASTILAASHAGGMAALVAEVEARSRRNPASVRLFLLEAADGRILAGNLAQWPQDVPHQPTNRTVVLDPSGSQVARIGVHAVPGVGVLLVGTPIPEHRQILRLEAELLVGMMVLMLITGVAAGIIIARHVLGRLEMVNRTASTILNGAFGQRVPRLGRGDEFDLLAENINAMLDRIESLLATVHSVTHNIAHDLRAPLNRLRGRLELALMAPRRSEDYQQTLSAAIVEADEIIETFNAMLTIARIEGGAAIAHIGPVDLEELLSALADLYQPLAEESGLTLEVVAGPGIIIAGDRHLLSQAVSNLIDNAIKYTPAGGHVVLRADPTADGAALTVSDTGPGIAEASRCTVLQPFTRLDPARSMPGTGLGLSLVAAVAERHRATLSLGDNAPGLTVRFDFRRG
jgi:signal transduction histidine kinase